MPIISTRPRIVMRLIWLSLPGLALLIGLLPPLVMLGETARLEVSPRNDALLAQTILQEAATALGWAISPIPISNLPGEAWQVAMPPAGSSLMSLVVSVAPSAAEQTLLLTFVSQGLPSGLFHGREAIILHSGDAVPLGSSMEDGEPTYAPSQHGLIAWRCGPYALVAADETGTGLETKLAEMLFRVAERRSLCGLPASIIVLARTGDMPPVDALNAQVMADMAQRYYDANGYGRVSFDLTFLGAGGHQCPPEWITDAPSGPTFERSSLEFALEALQSALGGRALAQAAYIERAIVVCPADGMATLSGSTAAHVYQLLGGDPFELWLPQAGSRVWVSQVALVRDDDDLGAWVHELGHTLYAREPGPFGQHRLTDRYNAVTYEKGLSYGDLGGWDVMARGCFSGRLCERLPVHMSSYTKVAANWLSFGSAPIGVDLTLASLEHQRIGDRVLSFDQLLFSDPRSIYFMEARDHDTAYGAPASGVVIYLLTYDDAHGHAVVSKLTRLGPDLGLGQLVDALSRPTLYGVGQPDGVTQIDLVGGYRVTLVSEQFQPYRATVRIERR